MSDIMSIQDIQYLNFNTNENTFDLLLKLNINNISNNNYIQGILSLNSSGDLISVKESILFVGDIPCKSENIFYCILNKVPLLYNSLNINASDILNYTLNVKLLSPNLEFPSSPIKISLNQSIKLNLKHKKFYDFKNEKLDIISYDDSFKCFDKKEFEKYNKEQQSKSISKDDIKSKLLSIIKDNELCNTNDQQIINTKENKINLFNIKTNKQNISISLNKSTYALNPTLKNIYLSLKFEKKHQVSAISAQVFKYYNLSNFQGKIKVSPKIDKFTLFNDDSVKISIPLYEDEITEPGVPNVLNYYLLIKFIEPELEQNDSGNQYFDIHEQKNMLSQTLKSDIEGNLGLCQIPLSVKYF